MKYSHLIDALRNSGLKCFLSTCNNPSLRTFSLMRVDSGCTGSSVIFDAPTLLIAMMTVFEKSTKRPFPSVSTDRRTPAADVTRVGTCLLDLLKQDRAVSPPPDALSQLAAPPLYPHLTRRRAGQASDSVTLIYSDMSIQIVAGLSQHTLSGSALASSVLPTPGCPTISRIPFQRETDMRFS
jgi:hypothetical protein